MDQALHVVTAVAAVVGAIVIVVFFIGPRE